MSEDKKKVPKLRFPGFEGEWEETRLGDAVERITRKNINNETGLPLTISAKYGLIDQESFFNNIGLPGRKFSSTVSSDGI